LINLWRAGPKGDVVTDGNVGNPIPDTVRQREADLLFTALNAVSNEKTGRVAELVGEPGAGKTRLVAVLAREATRRGIAVMTARCTEPNRHELFQPFTQALLGQGIPAVDLLDNIATRLDFSGDSDTRIQRSENQSVYVYNDIRKTLADLADNGALLAIDDFHYADDESVRLVEHLVRSPVPGLLLLVVHRLRQASAQLRSALTHGVELGTVERIQLQALSLSQSAQLLSLPSQHHRLRQLHRASDGIPAYLTELAYADKSLTTGDAEPPSTAILTELAALGTVDSVTLSAAAVLGDTFDLEALSYVAGVQPPATRASVSDLIRRDLIRPVNEPLAYSLRHTVVRDVVYNRTDPTWRLLAHGRALRLLTERDVPVTDRTVHIERLLDRPEHDVLSLLVRASEEMIAEHAASAVRWMQAALRPALAVRLNYPARLSMSVTLARALVATGQAVDARELLREILAFEPGGPPAVRSSAVALCAQLEWLLGYHAEAGSLIANELAGRRTPPTLDMISLIVTDQLVQGMQNDAKAYEQAVRCLCLARDEGDRIAEAGALALVATHKAGAGNAQAARSLLAACSAIIDQVADNDLAVTIEYLAVLGWAQYGLEQFVDAKRHLNRGVRLARKTGRSHLLPFMLIGLSKTYLATGPLDKALRSAQDSTELARRLGSKHLQGLSLAMQSFCATAAEPDHVHAVQLAEQAIATLPVDEPWWRAELTMSLAAAVLGADDPLRCVALLLDAGGDADLSRLPLIKRAGCFEMMTMAAARAGDLVGSDEWAQRTERVAEATKLTSNRAQAQAARAHAMRATGELDKAMQLYRQAAESFSSLHMATAQAWMLFLAAPCALAADMFRDAAAMLALSRELARRSGAWDLYAKTKEQQRALEDIGKSSRGDETADPLRDKLTAREYEVARIAADGKRTKEIAEELNLSARTVEVHLSHIYRKLHVTSRAALASKVARAS
jgi:DNA-binding CsgD family transcriptional regulator